MLRVYRSNRAENLVDVLAEVLFASPAGPMETEWITVSNLGMGVWLQRELAKRMGIFAGACFPFPREVLDVLCFGSKGDSAYREETVRLAVFELLPSLMQTEAFRTLAEYLEDDIHGAKRIGLAAKVAHAFSEYTLYRPEMVLRWERGDGSDWQPCLWRAVVHRLGAGHIARGAVNYLRNDLPLLWKHPPFGRLFLFAVPALPPLYISVLRSLSRYLDVHLLCLNPCSEWWGDVPDRKKGVGVVPDALSDDAEMSEYDNPFLTSLGKIGRDFQWILEERVAYEEYPGNLYVDPLEEARESALRVVQSDLLQLRFGPRQQPPARLDDSIRIVSCHGPEREVEVLKDHILDLFDENSRLRPDDVLVMAPDMSIYAPFVEAVFSTGEHPIAFNLTLNTGTGTEMLRAFSALISLHGRRLTVAEVFDLLSFTPIRTRFDLDEEAVLEAGRWIIESEVRWGIDEDHREAHGQPRFRENTWRFGLDRLMLGLALDEEALLFGGVSPRGFLSGDSALTLGCFADFAETLFGVLTSFEGSRSLAEWMSLLKEAICRLFLRTSDFESGHQTILQILDALTESGEISGQRTPVSFSVVKKMVGDALLAESGAKGWRPSGVTFSDFSTMRGIPFKVIALLGMNEGAFPRHMKPPQFDLIAKRPKIGDRQVTHDDRYHFLETLLSARDTLILSYEGQSQQDNSPKPPSVVVSELAENLGRCFELDGRPLTVSHPLQPFGSPYFVGGDPRLFSYSHADLTGALTRRNGVSGVERFFKAPLKATTPELILSIDSLTRFFSKPASTLLRHRLGMHFFKEEELPETREPMKKGGREDRFILETLVRRGGDGMEPAALRRLFQAGGLLPHGSAGEVRFQRLLAETELIVAAVKEVRDGAPISPVELDLRVGTADGAVRIVGALEQLWPMAQLAYGYAYLSGARLINLWIRHLVLAALERDDLPAKSICIGRKKGSGVDLITLLEPPTEPLLLLGDLVDLYRIGLERPLRLIPRLSYEYAKTLESCGDPEKARMQVGAKWRQGFEASDTALSVAFRGTDPLGPDPLGGTFAPFLGFENLAERVFFPLLDAIDKGAL